MQTTCHLGVIAVVACCFSFLKNLLFMLAKRLKILEKSWKPGFQLQFSLTYLANTSPIPILGPSCFLKG